MYQPKHLKQGKSGLSYERKCQIAMGVIILVLSAVLILLASATEEKDITPVVFLIPLGIFLIFTKNIVIQGR